MSMTIAMVALGFTLAAAAQTRQGELPLDALTVPTDVLGDVCSLPSSSTAKLDGGRVRSGLWVGLPIPRNPWRGSDDAIMAAIRGRLEPPFDVPDGPPFSAAELARFRIQLARDLEEAYAAVYATDETGSSRDLVTVYAMRFKDLREVNRLRANPKLSGNVRFVGRTAFVLHGARNQCFGLVANHLEKLDAR